MQIEVRDGISFTIPNGSNEYRFSFDIPKDDFMSANDIPFVRSPKQSAYFKHLHIRRKQNLVALGKRTAEEQYSGDPIKKAFIVVEARNYTNHRFDAENSEITFKHIQDGLVQGGVLEDDNSNVVMGTMFILGERSDQPKTYRIVIRVFDLGDDSEEDDNAKS